MNSIQTIRKKHLIIFFISVLLSALMLGGAAFLGERVLSETSKTSFNEKAQVACFSFLRAQGFNPRLRDEEIKVHDPTDRNREEVLHRASLAIAYCAAHELTQFCAGDTCEEPGVSFSLKQNTF